VWSDRVRALLRVRNGSRSHSRPTQTHQVPEPTFGLWGLLRSAVGPG